MTRTALLLLSATTAGVVGALAWRVSGLDWPLAVWVAVAVWLAAASLGGIVRSLVLRARLAREREDGRLARGLAAAAAVDRVAHGGEGFTAGRGSLLALERAVLLLPAQGPLRGEARERMEQAVRSDLARSTPFARAAIVGGLRDVADASVEALDAPLHPLFPLAARTLVRLGLRSLGLRSQGRSHSAAMRLATDRLRLAALRHGSRESGRRDAGSGGGSRTQARVTPFAFFGLGAFFGLSVRAQRQRWERSRGLLDPLRPAEGLAARLLAAGLERAALAALAHAHQSVRSRRLRRLARCRSLLLDAADGALVAVSPATLVQWREELLLLAGRRLPELTPGSALLQGVPGGAAELERTVQQTPVIVAELTALLDESPELERAVATVVARIVGWPVGSVVSALREGTLTARPDEALRSHLRGLALIEERRLAEAGAEFEAALVQAPDFAQAAFALATTKRRLGHVAAGEAVLRALVERRSREPEPALFLARYLSSVGERERARAAYERAVGTFPDCVPLRVAFAQELLTWGRTAEAAEQLAAARDAAPEEPRLALLAGRTLAGEIRLDEAAKALELAARGLRGAERGEAWFWLMNVRRDQGDHATAQRIARRLIHVLGPGQSSFLDDVAEYLEERQDYVRAREATERARRLRERGG